MWKVWALLVLMFSTTHACTNLQVAVKDIYDCSGTSCKATIQIPSFISENLDRSSCYKLYVENKFVAFLNVTALAIFRSQPAEYCYYSDDPYINYDIRCYCAAASGTYTTGCPNIPPLTYGNIGSRECQAIVPTGSTPPDYAACTANSFVDNVSCFNSMGAASYCAQFAFFLNERFKICKLKAPQATNFVLSIVSSTDDGVVSQSTISYNFGSLPFQSNSTLIDIQVNSFDPHYPDARDFVVWDKMSPEFYYLGKDLVNEKNEHNASKLGYWVKTTSTQYLTAHTAASTWVPISIVNLYGSCSMGITLVDYKRNYNSIVSQLRTLQDYNVMNQRTPVYLSDSEYTPYTFQNYPSTFDDYKEYWFIMDGLISFRKDNPSLVQFVGKTFEKRFVPLAYQQLDSHLTIATTRNDVDILFKPILRCAFYNDYTTNDPCRQLCVVNDPQDATVYGMCRMDSCVFDPNKLVCMNPVINVIIWPDMKKSSCKFNNTLSCMNTIVEKQNSTNVMLNALSASFSMDIVLRNLSVTFRHIDVRPIITECSYSSGAVGFTLFSSEGTAGIIVMFSNPNVSSLSPVISIEKQTYYVATNASVSGELVITAINGNFSSSCIVTVPLPVSPFDVWKNFNVSTIPVVFFDTMGITFTSPLWVKNLIFYSMIACAAVIVVLFLVLLGVLVYYCCVPNKQKKD